MAVAVQIPKDEQGTALEREFAFQCRAYRLPAPVRELAFALVLGRKFRLDFAWPDYKLGIELQGLVVEKYGQRNYVRGGHGTVPGMIRDMDKLNHAVLLGWSVMQFEQGHVKRGDAIAMVQRALAVRGWDGSRIDKPFELSA